MNTSLLNFVKRFDVSFSDKRIKIAEPYYRDNVSGELIIILRDIYSYSLYAYNSTLFCTYLDVLSWNKRCASISKNQRKKCPPPEIIVYEILQDRTFKEISRILNEKDLQHAIETYLFPF